MNDYKRDQFMIQHENLPSIEQLVCLTLHTTTHHTYVTNPLIDWQFGHMARKNKYKSARAPWPVNAKTCPLGGIWLNLSGLLTPYGLTELCKNWVWLWLVADGTELLPEPMLTNHQWGLATFIWGQFYRNWSMYLFWYKLKNSFEDYSHISQGPMS